MGRRTVRASLWSKNSQRAQLITAFGVACEAENQLLSIQKKYNPQENLNAKKQKFM
jgi:hypothetical protein